MSMAGYQPRGSPIAGMASMGNDNIPYTTLSYANGPGFSDHFKNGQKTKSVFNKNPNTYYFRQMAPVPKYSESHGSDDVGIYAQGTFHFQLFLNHI